MLPNQGGMLLHFKSPPLRPAGARAKLEGTPRNHASTAAAGPPQADTSRQQQRSQQQPSQHRSAASGADDSNSSASSARGRAVLSPMASTEQLATEWTSQRGSQSSSKQLSSAVLLDDSSYRVVSCRVMSTSHVVSSCRGRPCPAMYRYTALNPYSDASGTVYVQLHAMGFERGFIREAWRQPFMYMFNTADYRAFSAVKIGWPLQRSCPCVPPSA